MPLRKAGNSLEHSSVTMRKSAGLSYQSAQDPQFHFASGRNKDI
jgi:hypothetical protein